MKYVVEMVSGAVVHIKIGSGTRKLIVGGDTDSMVMA
jgi:hypothetical protein